MKSIYSYALAVEEILEPLTPEQREQVILLVYQPVPDAPRAETVAVTEKRDARTSPKSGAERQTEIMDMLRAHGPEMRCSEIAKRLGITQQALSQYLIQLTGAGCVTRAHGRVRLTPSGKAGVWR